MKVKELKEKIEVEHIEIFLTHYDNYLDICLDQTNDTEFIDIKELHDELKVANTFYEITKEEYLKRNAEIFHKYISMLESNKK